MSQSEMFSGIKDAKTSIGTINTQRLSFAALLFDNFQSKTLRRYHMIKRSNEFRKENIPNLKDGDGVIKIENFFEESDFYGIGRLFGISIIEPGCSIGLHSHIGEQEAYYILEGEALYDDNGTECTLKPGDYSLCKDGESHGIKCKGDVPLKYIAFIMYTNKG